MKLKNIFFVLSIFTVQSSAIFAARMTVYNESSKIQDVNVYSEEQVIAAFRLGPNEKRSVNTGSLATFSGIKWQSPFYDDVLQKKSSIRYKEGFYTPLKSSGTMLMGSATLFPGGVIGMNFGKNGVYSSEIKQRNGTPVVSP